MLGLGFSGFRMLVIVLEFIVPDEFFTYKWRLKIIDYDNKQMPKKLNGLRNTKQQITLKFNFKG